MKEKWLVGFLAMALVAGAGMGLASAAGKGDAPKKADKETAEQTQLAEKAEITAKQAEEAALAEVPGTVTGTELEDENGTVVYGVEISAEKGNFDVKVDAKTGKVLKAESDDDDEAEGENEKSEKEDDNESDDDSKEE